MPAISKFSPWLNERMNNDISFLRSHAATPSLSPEERAYLKHVNAGLRLLLEGVPSSAPSTAPVSPPTPHARLPRHHRAYVLLNPECLTLHEMAAKLDRPVQTLAQIRSDHRMRVLGFPPNSRPRRRTGPAEHLEPYPAEMGDGVRVHPTHQQARDRWAVLHSELPQLPGTLPLPKYFNNSN